MQATVSLVSLQPYNFIHERHIALSLHQDDKKEREGKGKEGKEKEENGILNVQFILFPKRMAGKKKKTKVREREREMVLSVVIVFPFRSLSSLFPIVSLFSLFPLLPLPSASPSDLCGAEGPVQHPHAPRQREVGQRRGRTVCETRE
jgi:hypothetical protein